MNTDDENDKKVNFNDKAQEYTHLADKSKVHEYDSNIVDTNYNEMKKKLTQEGRPVAEDLNANTQILVTPEPDEASLATNMDVDSTQSLDVDLVELTIDSDRELFEAPEFSGMLNQILQERRELEIEQFKVNMASFVKILMSGKLDGPLGAEAAKLRDQNILDAHFAAAQQSQQETFKQYWNAKVGPEIFLTNEERERKETLGAVNVSGLEEELRKNRHERLCLQSELKFQEGMKAIKDTWPDKIPGKESSKLLQSVPVLQGAGALKFNKIQGMLGANREIAEIPKLYGKLAQNAEENLDLRKQLKAAYDNAVGVAQGSENEQSNSSQLSVSGEGSYVRSPQLIAQSLKDMEIDDFKLGGDEDPSHKRKRDNSSSVDPLETKKDRKNTLLLNEDVINDLKSQLPNQKWEAAQGDLSTSQKYPILALSRDDQGKIKGAAVQVSGLKYKIVDGDRVPPNAQVGESVQVKPLAQTTSHSTQRKNSLK